MAAMRQIESLQVAIHAAEGCEIGWRKLGFREYDVRVGCFLSLRQLCQKAKYRRKKEVMKNMNQEKLVEEVIFENLRFANEKNFHQPQNLSYNYKTN